MPEIFVDVRVHIAVHKIADGGSVTEFVARTAVARHEMLFHRIARNRIGKIFECGVDIFASVLRTAPCEKAGGFAKLRKQLF